MQVSIKTADGICNAYVAHPEGNGPWPGVLFYQDGLGVRPALHQMADRLAAMGYYVLLPNMFYRFGDFAPFDAKTVFAGPGPEMDRLMKMLTACSDAEWMRDTKFFFDHLAENAKGDTFGITGYCMGGGLALLAACDYPDRVAAAASFHGGRFVVEETAPAILRDKLQCEVYIGVAEIDRRHTAETSKRLEEGLAGKPHTIELYPGAHHGWCVPDAPVSDQPSAERHWQRLADLLKRNLA